ncbi:putative toxin-antitoxin system toxin component, PIN family [bacterium JGI 053]|nr:putative toxin-antitoxin system toxin component, PIN family [bacterium JGI 053]
MRLFRHCVAHHAVVTSPHLVAELEEKLLRKLKIASTDVAAAIAELQGEVETIHPEPLPAPVSRDADDDWVLATALAGNCDCIVTGDADLLVLKVYEGITILPPRDFWEFELGHVS